MKNVYLFICILVTHIAIKRDVTRKPKEAGKKLILIDFPA